MKKFISAALSIMMVLSLVCVPVSANSGGGMTGGGGSTNAAKPVEPVKPEISLPTATVTEIDVAEIADDVELTYALNFSADEASEEEFGQLADWYADFVFMVNKDVTLDATSEDTDCYLAGQYDNWSESWVKVPVEGIFEITANEPVKIMETAAEIMGEPGLKYTCGEVYEYVKNFKCGVYFSDEFIAENPDLITSLELRIYNNENEEEWYTIGEKTYVFEATELPTATVTEIDTHTLEDIALTYALNFTADEATDAQLKVYGDWYADFVFTVNKNVVFSAEDECANGYLAGQYDAWSENWVKVPPVDVLAVEADVPMKIMETAAELMGEPGLKYTYAEVYEYVKNFKCGVYFTEDFILENPDLVTSLELRVFNPENEEESYTIGKLYTFVVKKTITEENVEVQGTKLTGGTVEIQKVDTTEITEGTQSVTIDTNALISEDDEESVVESVKLPAEVIETVENLGSDAALNITLANKATGNDIEVSINKDALKAIVEELGEEEAEGLVLKVEETEDLSEDQGETVEDLENTVVYKITMETESGKEIYTTPDTDDGRKIIVKVPYTKVGDGEIVVKHLKDDGTLEDVEFKYADGVITMYLAHFSDYLIHQLPEEEKNVSSSGGGGGTTTRYIVKFESNGGTPLKELYVKKNSVAEEPTKPEKEGFTFAGWFADKELTVAYDFETAVVKNIILYAKWTEGEAKTDEPSTPAEGEDVKADGWFADVADTAWYYEDVKYITENKIMNGLTETTFGPDELLTRAMLVTMLYRNEGEPAVNKSIPFADIDLASYYANAVIWAQQNAIVNGVSETEFAPDENITREQIAAIMHRYATFKGLDVSAGDAVELANYDDFGSVHNYAILSVKYAIGSGLIKGKTERTIAPRDNATRAEIAAILHRFIESGK